MPHPLHDEVRRAYNYRCGYCGVTEAAAGGQLTVDHYQPRAAGGTDDLSNLVYACHRCNQYKGDYWPTPERLAAGLFVLHPHRHDLSQHLLENELSGELEALTPTGAFHLRLLQLNRPELIAHRLERRAVAVLRQQVPSLQARLAQREQAIEALQKYVSLLLRLGRFRPPAEE
jgi:hypothetical protein